MKVWIATPSLTGTVTCEFAQAMAKTLLALDALRERGIAGQWHTLSHCNLLHFARQRMAEQFMASDFTDMLFIDDDIEWEATETADLLLNYDQEVIGGICPRSDGTLNYRPTGAIDGGLIEAQYVGTGIMRIKRSAFERIGSPYFEAPYGIDGGMIGEDVWFCERVRTCGGDVWALPMTVRHRGYTIRRGDLCVTEDLANG